MIPNDYNIGELYKYIKQRIHNNDYCNLNLNIIDVIIEYCIRQGFDEDDLYDLAEMIKNNQLVYEFIEVEARKKRQLIMRDYRNNKNLNEKYMSNKISLLSIFRRKHNE